MAEPPDAEQAEARFPDLTHRSEELEEQEVPFFEELVAHPAEVQATEVEALEEEQADELAKALLPDAELDEELAADTQPLGTDAAVQPLAWSQAGGGTGSGGHIGVDGQAKTTGFAKEPTDIAFGGPIASDCNVAAADPDTVAVPSATVARMSFTIRTGTWPP